MDDNSILNPQGLRKLQDGKRFRLQQEFVKRSQVVFYLGKPIGNIYTPEAFKAFLDKYVPGEMRRETAYDMFMKFSRAWGAAGHRVYPIEMLDGLLDFISKD